MDEMDEMDLYVEVNRGDRKVAGIFDVLTGQGREVRIAELSSEAERLLGFDPFTLVYEEDARDLNEFYERKRLPVYYYLVRGGRIILGARL